METVLNIPELVRDIVSHSSMGVMLLFTNRNILEQEPCAVVYRTWAETGCPTEHTCLPGIGGVESTFCVGRFKVTIGHKYLFYVEKSLLQICSQLDSYINLHNDDYGILQMTFHSGGTRIHIFTLAPNQFKVVLSYSGWQKIEDYFILTKEKTKSLVYQIMKTTGEVTVNGIFSFNVERRLTLSVILVDELQTHWNILQVSRTR